MTPRGRLEAFIEATLRRPVDPRVRFAAADIAHRFGDHAQAVLFYGSCLRSGEVAGLMLDFYLLVDDYQGSYGNILPAIANRLLPPNVYYWQGDVEGETIRAKYAVLSVDHFSKLAGPQTFNPAVWARFAQPVALVYGGYDQLVATLADAHLTLIGRTWRPGSANVDPLDPWRAAFAATYRTELRAERQGRAADIVAADADHYRALTPMVAWALVGTRLHSGRLMWALRRVEGKALHVLRLIKAAATFDGGIDYLAWKIERHSGIQLTVSPWQRRHPVLAGLGLFVKLRLMGAFR